MVHIRHLNAASECADRLGVSRQRLYDRVQGYRYELAVDGEIAGLHVAHRSQKRKPQDLFDLLRGGEACIKHLLGHGTPDSKEETNHETDRHVLDLAWVTRRRRR